MTGNDVLFLWHYFQKPAFFNDDTQGKSMLHSDSLSISVADSSAKMSCKEMVWGTIVFCEVRPPGGVPLPPPAFKGPAGTAAFCHKAMSKLSHSLLAFESCLWNFWHASKYESCTLYIPEFAWTISVSKIFSFLIALLGKTVYGEKWKSC